MVVPEICIVPFCETRRMEDANNRNDCLYKFLFFVTETKRSTFSLPAKPVPDQLPASGGLSVRLDLASAVACLLFPFLDFGHRAWTHILRLLSTSLR